VENKMSKLEELLKKEKVEWKKPGDVCEVGTGKSNTNEQVDWKSRRKEKIMRN